MSIVIMVIIGAVIGWLAAAVMGRDESLFASVVIGIVGSFIGGFLASVFGANTGGYLAWSWSSAIWAFIGSVILVALLNVFQHGGRRHHTTI